MHVFLKNLTGKYVDKQSCLSSDTNHLIMYFKLLGGGRKTKVIITIRVKNVVHVLYVVNRQTGTFILKIGKIMNPCNSTLNHYDLVLPK